jgi:hypothetical protein
MTDANITGLISSTISTLSTAVQEYNVINNDDGLQPAFYKAGRRLPLLVEGLQTVETQLNGRRLAGDPYAAIALLEDCNAQAKQFESIVKRVAHAPENQRFELYRLAVRQQGQGKEAMALALGIMKSVRDLAENDTIKATMEGYVIRLRDAIDKLSKMEVSVPNESPGNYFYSYHNSRQFNSLGGTQNNNTGNGNYFGGASFSGTVNFGGNK